MYSRDPYCLLRRTFFAGMANVFQPRNLVEERTSPQRETPGSITEREIPLSRSLLAWSLKKIGKNIVLNVWTRFEITLRQRLEIREIFPWSEDAFLISVTAIWVKLRKCSISDGRRHLLKTFLLKDSDLFTAESGEIKLSVGEKQITTTTLTVSDQDLWSKQFSQ